MNKKNIIISYSYLDNNFANKITNDLMITDVEVIDHWEINQGDSLTQKIFSEGLSNAGYFLIILSNNFESNLIEDLNSVIFPELEKITHVILLLKEPVDIPPSLKNIEWIDMYSNYKDSVNLLVDRVYNGPEERSINEIPEHIITLERGVDGISVNASKVGILLTYLQKNNFNYEKNYSARELYELVNFMTIEEFNDAVNELEEYGFIKTITFPNEDFYFEKLKTIYTLFLHFKDEMDYDPYTDIISVAKEVEQKKQITGKELNHILNISPVRLNRAVAYLEGYGHIKVHKSKGTAPYDFDILYATDRTQYLLIKKPLDKNKVSKAKKLLLDSYYEYSVLPDLFNIEENSYIENYVKVYNRPLINKDCFLKDVHIDCNIIYYDISKSIANKEKKYFLDKILKNFTGVSKETSYFNPSEIYNLIKEALINLLNKNFNPNLLFIPQDVLTIIRGESGNPVSPLYDSVIHNKYLKIDSFNKLNIIRIYDTHKIIIMDSNVINWSYKIDKRTQERLWIDINIFEEDPSKVDVLVRSKLGINIENPNGIELIELTNTGVK